MLTVEQRYERFMVSERNVVLIVVVEYEQRLWFHFLPADFGDANENGGVGPFHLKQINGGEEIHEFLETISPMVNRALVIDAVGDIGKIGPTFFIRGGTDGITEGVDEFGVALEVLAGLEVGVRLGLVGFLFGGCRFCWFWFFQIDEARAGVDKGSRSFLLAESEHLLAIGAETLDEWREVAVRGNEAKSMEILGIEQVHCIDDQRYVRGILPFDEIEGLHRLDGIFMQHFDPSAKIRLGPVTISTTDVDHTMSGEFRKDEVDFCRRCIVGIYQEGDAVGVGCCHFSEYLLGELQIKKHKTSQRFTCGTGHFSGPPEPQIQVVKCKRLKSLTSPGSPMNHPSTELEKPAELHGLRESSTSVPDHGEGFCWSLSGKLW